MTVCDVSIAGSGKLLLKGKDDRKLMLNYDSKAWKVSMEEPSFEGMEYDSFNKKWGGKKITRIILTSLKPKPKGENLFMFSPAD
jgi:hypothetical protein